MDNDLIAAKQKLTEGKHNIVLVKGQDILISDEKGIAPLMKIYMSGQNYREYSAADKIVGKAAAFLYILLGIKNIYAEVLAESALQILGGIHVEYGRIVPYIINRQGTGMCPMEDAVKDISDPNLAPKLLQKRISELNSGQLS